MIELTLKNLALGLTVCSAVNLTVIDTAVAQLPDKTERETLKESYLLSLKDIADSPSGYIHANPGLYAGSKQLPIDKVLKSLIKDKLQNDVEIRESLKRVRDKHPLSIARQTAEFALTSKNTSKKKSEISFIDFHTGRKVNKTRPYCLPESVGAAPLKTLQKALIDALTPVQQKINITGDGEVVTRGDNIDGVHISAHSVSGGWLTGYGSIGNDGVLTPNNKGLGLHYVPEDKSLPTKYLLAGTISAILPKSDEPGAFLVLSTSEPLYDWVSTGPLDVFLVKEIKQGLFDMREYRNLPDGLMQIQELQNGDLFLSFGGAKRSTERWGSMPVERPAYSKNPPVGLTAAGEIYAICEDDAIKF